MHSTLIPNFLYSEMISSLEYLVDTIVFPNFLIAETWNSFSHVFSSHYCLRVFFATFLIGSSFFSFLVVQVLLILLDVFV